MARFRTENPSSSRFLSAALALVIGGSVIGAASAADDPVCSLVTPPYEKIFPITNGRGRTYWSQTYEYPEGSGKYYLTSTEDGGCGGDNSVLDLQTGASVPGGNYRCDPFPSPDGRFLAHPGLQIYDMGEVMSRGASARAQYAISNSGLYASLGLLRKEGGSIDSPRVYRTVNWSGLKSRDFRATFAPGTQKPTGFTAVGESRDLCGNLTGDAVNRSTPILSKDGNMISIGTPTGTQVFRIDSATGNCTPIRSVGRQTSKANFSFDGNYIGFMENRRGESPTSTQYSQRGTLLDIRTGEELDLLPTMTDRDVVGYPTFRADGKVVVQVRSQRNGVATREVVVISIEDLKQWHAERKARKDSTQSRVQQFVNTCANEGTDALLAMARTWESLCARGVVADDKPLELLSSLNPTECRALVDRYWSSRATDAATGRVRKEDLVALCPGQALRTSSAPAASAPSAPAPAASAAVRTAQSVFAQKCVFCHQAGTPGGLIPFDDVNALRAGGATSWAAKIRARLELPMENPKRMPMGMQFDEPNDKNLILDYVGQPVGGQ